MMELITTFKGSIEDIENFESIVLATNKFSSANDHTFSKKELESIIVEAKKHKIKTYVLCNKMIFDSEVSDLESYLSYLKSLNVSGIYFSDMAVFMVAKSLNMHDLLIYAPGMTIVNSLDVKEYLSLGIQAVELANEITLDEKIKIANNNPNQVGIIISGYMLMSYSKRLALSNYFNEVNLDVKVKDNYNLALIEANRQGKMPIYEDENGTYIYSEYILDSLEFMQQLLEVDFKYFRIDGIFLDKTMIYDLYKTYADRLTNQSNADMSNILANKYPDYKFDNIFYTTETSEVK